MRRTPVTEKGSGNHRWGKIMTFHCFLRDKEALSVACQVMLQC